jgi:hypothetical protein
MMRGAVAAALLALAVGCRGSGPEPGVRDTCGAPGGPVGVCTADEIDSAEDACWKMVECGALAVARPDDQGDCGFCDWASCVAYVDALSDDQFELALDCVAAAPCDELKGPGSPDDPDPPPCLAQGQ